MNVTPSDEQVVSAFLDAVDGLTGTEIARRVRGVSADDVSRWRRGKWQRLSEPKRKIILAYLAYLQREGSEAEAEAGEVEGLLYSLDEVMRTLRKIDPEPGSQRARKKDALRLLREFWATLGESIPDWFWDIQERVERGEL